MASKTQESELVGAAMALDQELKRFQHLADGFSKAPLAQQKHLERGAQLLTDISSCDVRLSEAVNALVSVIARSRDQQSQSARGVEERAKELQARVETFQTLFQDFADLGKRAADLNGMLQAIVQAKGTAQRPDVQWVKQVAAQMGQLADSAALLVGRAQEKGFDDIERQSEGLRQQVLSAKNKLLLLEQKL